MTVSRLLGGWKTLLGLALPLIAASLSDVLLNVTDTVFVGQLGAGGLASVAAGSAIYLLAAEVVSAAAIGYQIVAARRFGAGDIAGVGRAFSAAITLTMAIAIFGAAVLWLGRPIVGLVTADPLVAAEASLWLRLRSPGLIFLAASVVLAMTFQSARRPRWVMLTALLTNALDVALTFVLVFGVGPVPALGVAGSAIASSIAGMCGCSLLGWAVWTTRLVRIDHGAGRRAEFAGILRLSGPEIASSAIDYAGNMTYLAIVATLGVTALAGGQVGLIVLLVLFRLASTIGVATQILIGQSLGQGKFDEARQHLFGGRLLTIGLMTGLGLTLAALATPIARLFTPALEVVAAAADAIAVIGLSLPFLAWATSSVGALRALGLTTLVSWTNIACAWGVQLPIAWILGIEWGFGLTGVFGGLFAYFVVRACWSAFLVRGKLPPRSLTPIDQAATSSSHQV